MEKSSTMKNDKPYATKEAQKKFYNSSLWRVTREKVLKRDNYECVWCREKGLTTTTNLEIDHHIIELEHGTEKDAVDLNNLKTLCKSCHNLRHKRFEHGTFFFNKKKKIYDDERW